MTACPRCFAHSSYYCAYSDGCALGRETGERMTAVEAHEEFGDLARIRNGITTWIEVEADGGVWKPIFEGQLQLIAYEWNPKP